MKTKTIIASISTAMVLSTSVFAASVTGSSDADTTVHQPPASPVRQAPQPGLVTVIPGASQTRQAKSTNTIDYENAKPMPMPMSGTEPSSQLEALQANEMPRQSSKNPGSSSGSVGSGKLFVKKLAKKKELISTIVSEAASLELIAPQAYGDNEVQQPFTTSRINAEQNQTSSSYPYRATGKLFFNIDGGTPHCSASLIQPGVVVTAAHCVMDFGSQRYFSNWKFVPAYNNGTAPYGVWSVSDAVVMSSYFDGTDRCLKRGVICENDVAVLLLNPKYDSASGKMLYAGHLTGWYGYGWDGSGFNSLGQALISQLGYPGALDQGQLMERTDSQGFKDSKLQNHTIIGSLQTAGSSGGPWLVNLGIAPVLDGVTPGNAASRQMVVGVTSYGTDIYKYQGASQFTSNNIVPLVNRACEMAPGACS